MDVIKTEKKYLNMSEECHIYKINRDRLHMNVTYIDIHNVIFEALKAHISSLLATEGWMTITQAMFLHIFIF